MKQPLIKNMIMQYLEEKKDWVFGGVIEDHIGLSVGSKASNVSRRCRELVREGKLDRQIVSVEGLRVVQYRVRPKLEPIRVVDNLFEKQGRLL